MYLGWDDKKKLIVMTTNNNNSWTYDNETNNLSYSSMPDKIFNGIDFIDGDPYDEDFIWIYDIENKTIIQKSTNKCLTINDDLSTVSLKDYSSASDKQQWKLSSFTAISFFSYPFNIVNDDTNLYLDDVNGKLSLVPNTNNSWSYDIDKNTVVNENTNGQITVSGNSISISNKGTVLIYEAYKKIILDINTQQCISVKDNQLIVKAYDPNDVSQQWNVVAIDGEQKSVNIPYDYIGCYQDQKTRALSDKLEPIDNIDDCYNWANQKGYSYFSLQRNEGGNICSGGNSGYDKYVKLSDDDCKYKIIGSSNNIIRSDEPESGTNWINAVYKIKQPKVVAQVPKVEPKVEPKPEPKPEPKVDPKPEPKPEPKVEPSPIQDPNLTCDRTDRTKCIFKSYKSDGQGNCKAPDAPYSYSGPATPDNNAFKNWLRQLYYRDGGFQPTKNSKKSERYVTYDYYNRCKDKPGNEYLKDLNFQDPNNYTLPGPEIPGCSKCDTGCTDGNCMYGCPSGLPQASAVLKDGNTTIPANTPVIISQFFNAAYDNMYAPSYTINDKPLWFRQGYDKNVCPGINTSDSPSVNNLTCDRTDKTKCIFKSYKSDGQGNCKAPDAPYNYGGLQNYDNNAFKNWLRQLYYRDGGFQPTKNSKKSERYVTYDYYNRCKDKPGNEYLKDLNFQDPDNYTLPGSEIPGCSKCDTTCTDGNCMYGCPSGLSQASAVLQDGKTIIPANTPVMMSQFFNAEYDNMYAPSYTINDKPLWFRQGFDKNACPSFNS